MPAKTLYVIAAAALPLCDCYRAPGVRQPTPPPMQLWGKDLAGPTR